MSRLTQKSANTSGRPPYGFILGVQLLPALLLILSGWGFDDLSGLLQNPARLGLMVITFAGVVIAVVFRLDFHPLRKGTTPGGSSEGSPDESQSLQLGILLLLSLLLLWFLPFADRRRILTFHRNWWRYAGLVLYGVGVTLRLLAQKALGDCFSAYVTLQPNHRLVQEGIYRSIRHPLYLGLVLVSVGMALVFASWLALPILILAMTFVFDRMPKEERLLAGHFGREFEDYQHRTSKLIPFLFLLPF